jgi:hypothetical protein
MHYPILFASLLASPLPDHPPSYVPVITGHWAEKGHSAQEVAEFVISTNNSCAVLLSVFQRMLIRLAAFIRQLLLHNTLEFCCAITADCG